MDQEKNTKVQIRHDFANPGVEAAVAALVLQNPDLLLAHLSYLPLPGLYYLYR